MTLSLDGSLTPAILRPLHLFEKSNSQLPHATHATHDAVEWDHIAPVAHPYKTSRKALYAP